MTCIFPLTANLEKIIKNDAQEQRARLSCSLYLGRAFRVLLISPIVALTSAIDIIAFTLVGVAGLIFCQSSWRRESDKQLKLWTCAVMMIPIILCLNLLSSKFENNSQDTPVYYPGPITLATSHKIRKFADHKVRPKEHFLHRHITSRFCYLVFAISSVITRTLDLMFSLVFLPLALACWGNNCYFNHYALRGLQITSLISDLIHASLGIISPSWENRHGQVTPIIEIE